MPYSQMCELSTFLKAALIAAKRSDVFIHYNDGPASGNLKGNGMCKGLDYFSIDSYRCPTTHAPTHPPTHTHTHTLRPPATSALPHASACSRPPPSLTACVRPLQRRPGDRSGGVQGGVRLPHPQAAAA